MMDFLNIVQEQQGFFETGKTKDVKFRVNALKKLESYICENDKDILAALKTDLNKSGFEAYAAEVGVVLDELRLAAKELPKWSRNKIVRSNIKTFPSVGTIYPEPYGTALIMSPWNYPFMLTITPLIAALAAGNCAIVKPSAYSPATSSVIAKMCDEVFDPGHVRVIEGGRKENEALLDQKYDIIFFTGSPAVGRTVMQAAAKHLTPVVLELGGKSPCIIDETANIKLAAKHIAWGKYLNAGQTCVAPDYLLAHKSIKDKLIEEITKEVKIQYGEEPLENDNFPKIINEKHFSRLLGLIEGENLAFGGKSDPDKVKIEPTLLEAGLDSPAMGEEIFGPILPVLTFNDRDEAVAIVKTLPKPLATYIFTSKKENERFFIDNISFGGGCVNDVVVHISVSNLPFGGVGESGMGNYHGKAGFDTFTHYKSVLHKSEVLDNPLRYPPYSDDNIKLLKKL